MKVPCASAKSVKAKKGYPTSIYDTNLPALLTEKPNAVAVAVAVAPSKVSSVRNKAASLKVSQTYVFQAPSKMDVSPSLSNGDSVSMEDSMSTCDSLKSPEVEYLDDSDVATLSSIHKKTSENLHTDDHMDISGLSSISMLHRSVINGI